MAAVWLGLQQFGLVSPAEAGPKARAAVQQALEADSTIAEVQFILAVMRTWIDWDWQGAEQAFRRALTLNSNYAEARAYYSHLLVFLARPDEAMQQADLAVAMDPLNPLIGALTCVTLSHIGRYEEAAARCEEILRADPTQPVAHGGLGHALLSSGRYEEHLAATIANARSRGDEEFAQALEQGFEEGGFERAMALAAEILVAQSEVGFVMPSRVARAFAYSRDSERALDWLERGVEVHDPEMPYSVGGTWPEEVLSHPRFREVLRQMGLPERE
jgi:tetratricopeptide (TPR) repeat protein